MGNNQSSDQSLQVSYDKQDSSSKSLNSTTSFKKYNKRPKPVNISNIGQQESHKFGIICCGKENIEQDWLTHLYDELDAESERQWCLQLYQTLQFFKGFPANYYQKELQWVFFACQDKYKMGLANYKPSIYKALNSNDQSQENYLSKIDEQNEVYFQSDIENNSLLNKSDYIDNNKNNKKINDENDDQTQTEAEEKVRIKKLLKQSYMIEEDFHNEQQLKFNSSSNLSQVFNSLKASTQSANVPSFIYQNVHNQKKEDPTNKDYIKQLDLYVKLTAKIKSHVKDSNCILNFILESFYRTYTQQYQEHIKQFQKLNKIGKNEQEIIENGISDLQQFIRIFQEVIVQFYNLIHSELKKNVPLFTRDNILNFVTSIVFDDQVLYDTLFNLQKLLDKQQNKLLEDAMKTGLVLNQNDMFIPHKFHLNENTKNYLIRKGKLPGKSQNNNNTNENEIIDKCNVQNNKDTNIQNREPTSDDLEDDVKSQNQQENQPKIPEIIHLVKNNENQITVEMRDQSSYTSDQQRGSMAVMEEVQSLKGIKKEVAIYSILKNDPYFESIKQIMKITKKNSPVGKMRVILKASEYIMKAINKYYNSVGCTFNNIIDSDDLLSIFNYITLKSNIPDLVTHCTLIERFSTNSILNAISGFYLTTLQASIDYLQNNITESFIEKKDLRNIE